MTTTLSFRLPAPLKAAFLQACERSAMSPPAVLAALIEGWTPVAGGHRSIPGNEVRTILGNAKGRK